MYFIRNSNTSPDQHPCKKPTTPEKTTSETSTSQATASAGRQKDWTTPNMKYWADQWKKKFDSTQRPLWKRIFLFQWVLSFLFRRDLHEFARVVCEGAFTPTEEDKNKKLFFTKKFLLLYPGVVRTTVVNMIFLIRIERNIGMTSELGRCSNILDERMFAIFGSQSAAKPTQVPRFVAEDMRKSDTKSESLLALAKKFGIFPEETKLDHFKSFRARKS